MAKNYIQDGNTVRLTATKAVTSGDVIVTESLVAIAVTDAARSEAVVGLTTGVFTVKAKQSDDIKQGAVLYWDDGAGEATITKGSNKVLGKAWNESGTSSAEVDVKINA